MAFQAIPSITGVPDFQLIHIDVQEVAKAFQQYLDTASKLTGVSLDDISLRVSKLPQDVSKATLVELVSNGMPLFDAVVWLSAGKPASHPLRVDPGLTADKIPPMHNVARAVFYTYFMLLTQARYPSASGGPDAPRIPNFLKVIMGMADDQATYVRTICSFDIQKFDPRWIRFVSFANFGQEVLSRFGLGVAGYRMFGPFALYTVRSDLPAELHDPVKFATAVAKAPPSWNVHPSTRSPNVLARRGNLNKGCGNLILAAFTDEQITEMVQSKILFAKPVYEAAHRQYLKWSPEDDITGDALIFQ